jgi:hypothetical protein
VNAAHDHRLITLLSGVQSISCIFLITQMFAGKPLTKEKAEQLTRWYFYAGFVGLPWLWAVNAMYFRRFQKDSDEIARYVRLSTRCAIVGFALLLLWVIVAQTSLSPTSSLWVIRPPSGAGGAWQSGFFADTVYQNT